MIDFFIGKSYCYFYLSRNSTTKMAIFSLFQVFFFTLLLSFFDKKVHMDNKKSF